MRVVWLLWNDDATQPCSHAANLQSIENVEDLLLLLESHELSEIRSSGLTAHHGTNGLAIVQHGIHDRNLFVAIERSYNELHKAFDDDVTFCSRSPHPAVMQNNKH